MLNDKHSKHEHWMRQALAEAREAAQSGDIPVGAVVVREGRVIGRGRNQREALQDPTAHAEILALTAAAEYLGSWRLDGCRLYVTMEPCPMCAGALVNSRIEECIYGVKDPKAGAVDSLYHLCEDPRLNHRCRVISGILLPEIEDSLKHFFQTLRSRDRGIE